MTTATEIRTLSFRDALGLKSRSKAGWQPYPHQIPPDWPWDTWLIKAGRGAGKTEAGAHYVLDHLERYGPLARVGVGAPTIADARDVCAERVTGVITLARSDFHYNRSLGEAWHKDGGYVKFLGSEEPARWNGPQWTLLWADELALWNEESWDMAQFGLRLGEFPRAIATTTPKNRAFIKALMADPTTAVSHATTYDNPALSARVLKRLEAKYGGTRLGRQELMAEMIEDVEGALWLREWIDENRVKKAPELVRVVTGVDPATTSSKTSDFTGIAVAGKGVDGEFYVLSVQQYKLSPHGWASKALDAHQQFGGDRIIAETNNGGDMVITTIQGVDRNAPVKKIVASRGKAVRAEPIAAMYEQGKVHHVGEHPDAESQMCNFPVATENDDMVDALVYALTELTEGSGLQVYNI